MVSVEFAARDLSYGVAWSSATSSSGITPKSLDHVGVMIDDILYEYGPRGITKRPKSEVTEKFEFMIAHGVSKKSIKDVDSWLDSQEKEWSGSNYDIVSHNCIKFARWLAKFLGVGEPKRFIELQEWVNKNQTICKFCEKIAPPP